MPCIDVIASRTAANGSQRRPRQALIAAAAALLLAGCAQPTSRPPGAAPPAPAAGSSAGAGGQPKSPAGVGSAGAVVLPPAPPARNWDEFKVQAALRIVAANPHRTYSGPVPDPLLAIPVLEIELARDGSVRRIEVLRVPSQAEDTIELAIEAVRRAAPYGDMSRLPQPWKFAEVFLFDDERRFKPRTLDVD